MNILMKVLFVNKIRDIIMQNSKYNMVLDISLYDIAIGYDITQNSLYHIIVFGSFKDNMGATRFRGFYYYWLHCCRTNCRMCKYSNDNRYY